MAQSTVRFQVGPPEGYLNLRTEGLRVRGSPIFWNRLYYQAWDVTA